MIKFKKKFVFPIFFLAIGAAGCEGGKTSTKPQSTPSPQPGSGAFKPSLLYVDNKPLTITGIIPDALPDGVSSDNIDMTIIAYIKNQAGNPATQVQYCSKGAPLTLTGTNAPYSYTTQINNCGGIDNIYAFLLEIRKQGDADDKSFAGSLINPAQAKTNQTGGGTTTLNANIGYVGSSPLMILDPKALDTCFQHPDAVSTSFANLQSTTYDWKWTSTDSKISITNFNDATPLPSDYGSQYVEAKTAIIKQAFCNGF